MKWLLMFSGSAILLSAAFLITVIGVCTYQNRNDIPVVVNATPQPANNDFE